MITKSVELRNKSNHTYRIDILKYDDGYAVIAYWGKDNYLPGC